MKILNDIAYNLNWMEIDVEGIENLLGTSVGEKQNSEKTLFHFSLLENQQNKSYFGAVQSTTYET
jgi:hypothetical protein